jgi:hypothetical protein
VTCNGQESAMHSGTLLKTAETTAFQSRPRRR